MSELKGLKVTIRADLLRNWDARVEMIIARAVDKAMDEVSRKAMEKFPEACAAYHATELRK